MPFRFNKDDYAHEPSTNWKIKRAIKIIVASILIIALAVSILYYFCILPIL